jgi:predicted phage terminase large subunit-like protein
VRYWDLAATGEDEASDPDFTAGVLELLTPESLIYVAHAEKFRLAPGPRDQRIRQRAELDGKSVTIAIEQEPGAAGKAQVDHFQRHVLLGWRVVGNRPSGDKLVRAGPFASHAQAGNVKLLRGAWNEHYLEELEGFGTEGVHDDLVDGSSGGYAVLTEKRAGDLGVTI